MSTTPLLPNPNLPMPPEAQPPAPPASPEQMTPPPSVVSPEDVAAVKPDGGPLGRAAVSMLAAAAQAHADNAGAGQSNQERPAVKEEPQLLPPATYRPSFTGGAPTIQAPEPPGPPQSPEAKLKVSQEQLSQIEQSDAAVRARVQDLITKRKDLQTQLNTLAHQAPPNLAPKFKAQAQISQQELEGDINEILNADRTTQNLESQSPEVTRATFGDVAKPSSPSMIPPPPARFSIRTDATKSADSGDMANGASSGATKDVPRAATQDVTKPSLLAQHVAQGSHLELLLRGANSAFRGTAEPVTSHDDVEQPPAIDKKIAPVQAAMTDFAAHPITPRAMNVIKSTAPLAISTPEAAQITHRLLSLGFSAPAVAEGVSSLKGIQEAYKDNNSQEAVYRMSYALISGALNKTDESQPGISNRVGATTPSSPAAYTAAIIKQIAVKEQQAKSTGIEQSLPFISKQTPSDLAQEHTNANNADNDKNKGMVKILTSLGEIEVSAEAVPAILALDKSAQLISSGHYANG